MIEGFLDEGGTHRAASLLSVAMCFGEHDQWVEFLSMWKETSFHSKEQEFDKLKPLLFQAIDKCKLHGFVCSVKPEEYNPNVSMRSRSRLGNAYACCTFACVPWLFQMGHGLSDSVSFTVEKGQPNAEFISRTVLALSTDPLYEERIASVSLVGKKKFRELHTADFIAHSWNTFDPVWVDCLRKTGCVTETVLTADKLLEISDKLDVLIRQRRAERRRLMRTERDGE